MHEFSAEHLIAHENRKIEIRQRNRREKMERSTAGTKE